MRTSIRLLLLALSGVFQSIRADEIWPDATAVNAAEYPNVASKTISLGHGISIVAKFDITTKGNGGLEIPGLGIRVYDAHNDGITYRNRLLTCEWRDENQDGLLDLVVKGVAQFYGEKGERVELERPIQGYFRYEPKEHRFVVAHCSPEIEYWKVALPGQPLTASKN